MPKSTAVWGWVWLYPFSKPSGFFLGSYIFLKTLLLSPTISSSCCDPVSDWKVVHGWAALQRGPDETVPFSHFSLHWNGISSQGSPKVCGGLAFTCVLCLPLFHCLQLSDFSPSPPQPYFLQLFCLLMAPQAYYHSLSSQINNPLSCPRAFAHAIANPQHVSSSSPHRAQPSSADLEWTLQWGFQSSLGSS